MCQTLRGHSHAVCARRSSWPPVCRLPLSPTGFPGLTHAFQYSLDPCRHLFCTGCITIAFRRQGDRVLWYTCPQCTCTVGTTPPLADRGVEPIASWLRVASGATMPSVEEVMKLGDELGDVCSWDHNTYLLSGDLVDPSPTPLQ